MSQLTDDIRYTCSVLFAPGQIVEVRALSDTGTASGYFDDTGRLAAQVETLDGIAGVRGIYVTLNEVNPALLSRRSNRIKMRLSNGDATTADTDILRRRWFPVDIDPVRPSGVSSSESEHAAALDAAVRVASYLKGMGWPEPVSADSGNGAHLLYPIDLPNTDANRDLVKRCLEVLADIFDDDLARIDTANYNAGRIWKLYGTISRKGDHTDERPHRRSRLISVPDEPKVTGEDLLQQLAHALPESPGDQKSAPAGRSVDLAGWLTDHSIRVRREKSYQGGTLFLLEECPFSGDHRDGAFAIQFPNGAVHAGCHHSSCGGGSQRWKELRERFEPAGKRPAGKRAKGRGTNHPEEPQPEDDIPMIDEARAVLTSGDPKETMLRTFFLDHEGDATVAECLVLSLASRSVINTNGLHVSVSGESGKGKSTAFSTMIRQVPEQSRMKDWMSNKALFYIEGLRPGSVIMIDDKALSEEMQEILKGVTSSFREPFVYRTVSIDRKGVVCIIPERCVWWVAKVEGSGDDQVFNRMLTCWIDDTSEQDVRCVTRSLHRDKDLPVDEGDERPEVLACRAMWQVIERQRFHVVIPFGPRIRFQTYANRRNPEMLLDLIKAHAVLRFMQREQVLSGRIPCLIATLEDFSEAARLYQLLNGPAGGQTTKLTKRESTLLDIIADKDWPEFTIPMLQRETGLPNGSLHKLIHGFRMKGCSFSGLLEKCPAISVVDRTVTTEEENGVCMRRRMNAYTFDNQMFSSWNSGGTCWIDDDPDDTCPSNTSINFHCPATKMEGHENDGMSPDFQNTGTDIHVPVHDLVSCNNLENSQQTENVSIPATMSLCDPGSLAGQDPKSAEISGIPEPGLKRPETSLQTDLQDKEGQEGQVRARDYKKLDVPERTPCFRCNGKWSHYVEKLTESRKKRPNGRQQARRICKSCYKKAMRKAQKEAVILPGTFDPDRMERLDSRTFRCSACDLNTAVYIDRGSGVKLCEFCYRRACGKTGREEATG